MLPYNDLFIWWAGTITAGILFLVIVSIVLYFTSGNVVVRDRNPIRLVAKALKNYAFVWVLLGLLALYLVSIDRQDYNLFAAGNVISEIFIFAYLLATSKIHKRAS